MTPLELARLVLTRIDDPEEAATWVAVALAESGGNPHAVNLVHHDMHGRAFRSVDAGLFQINTYWHSSRVTLWEMFEPHAAWQYAWWLGTGDGAHASDWSPWVAYKNGSYQRHMTAAREAVATALAEEPEDDMPTMYPTGYTRTLVTLDELFARHHVDKMHPEFARRLRDWLEAQEGRVGIGGSWRDNGTQPDKPGFAPEGKSFHQYQQFASGVVKFAAVDLVVRNGAGVHRAPTWDEVPEQGTPEAAEWGLHANVSSEPWHLQPIELDGHASWVSAGSPDPVANYPLPTDPPPTTTGDDMRVIRVVGDDAQYVQQGMFARWIPSGPVKQQWQAAFGFDPAPVDVELETLAYLVLVGPQPQGAGVTTSWADFGSHVA